MFLEALAANGGNVVAAAKLASISREALYDWKRDDEDFSAAWERALIIGSDVLEAEALRRAVEGTLSPVFHRGKTVGAVRQYSDTLLIFLMKGRRPEKYRDNYRLEHTGVGGGPVQTEIAVRFVNPENADR